MILPETARVQDGHLFVGGCDTVELARTFGTPLYVFDEATLRSKARAYRQAFESRYPNTLLCYAAKAFLNPWLAGLLAEEGFGLDVVSGGELFVARRAGFPMDTVHLHGNNKLPGELALALDMGVGRIVVDNFTEIPVIDQLAAERDTTARVLLRIAPGIEAHTHQYLRTGGAHSKFGIAVETDQAAEAVAQIMRMKHLKLLGFHAHIGSQIFDLLPFEDNVAILLDFSLQMIERHGLDVLEISPGGGLGIQYEDGDDPPSIDRMAEAITTRLKLAADRHGLRPRLIVEPGRSMVGQAGLTLYTAGAVKEVPGSCKFVAVDGGMADNVRPALYQAKYRALVANKADRLATEIVTIAGKFCESADILVEKASLPAIEVGDTIALPATGAYCIPLASNYNMSLKPPIVAVHNGQARLVRRRETYEDLLACEVL